MIGLFLLAGCTVGPDPRRPETVADRVEPFRHVGADPSSSIKADQEELHDLRGWWRRFGDDATTELVELALQNNLDLRIAAAQVMETESLLRAAGGARWPRIVAEASAARSRQVIDLDDADVDLDLPPEVAQQLEDPIAVRTTTIQLGLNVSWQADLFGRLRRAEQAALAQLMAARAERVATLHLVVAQTIRARVAVAALEQQLRLAERDIETIEDRLELIERRHRMGVGEAMDVLLSRQELAAARARLPELLGELELARHALDVLVGVQPARGPRPEVMAMELPGLPPPPVGVPAGLLDQRPDLVASELRHHAAVARVGVELAQLYPDLVLSGEVGFSARRVRNLFDPDHLIYTIAGQLSQMLFDGGARRAQVEAARARVDRAAAEYARRVLVAIREVEDTLVSEREARRTYEAAEASVEAAQEAEQLAQERYDRGVGTILEMLESERGRREAEQRRVLATQAVWNTRVDLHLALGGDWEIADEDVAITGEVGSAPRTPVEVVRGADPTSWGEGVDE